MFFLPTFATWSVAYLLQWIIMSSTISFFVDFCIGSSDAKFDMRFRILGILDIIGLYLYKHLTDLFCY